MKRRWLRWTGIALLSVVVLCSAVVMWALNTQSGARWALHLARNVTNGALQVRDLDGTLAGPLTLHGMQYIDPVSGLSVTAERIALDIAMSALFSLRVHVVNAELHGIEVALGEPAETPPDEDAGPFTLEAPIDIVVERFALRQAIVRRKVETLLALDSADFAGQWIGSAITVRQLDIRSPQGEIEFAGAVRDEQVYLGKGNGRFRWRSGEREFAGTIEADAPDEAAQLTLSLTAPMRATVSAVLRQRKSLPWTLDVTVPSFDPRESLLPDSSWHALSARLRGKGTLQQGVVEGEIGLNGEPIHFKRIAFERGDEAMQVLADLALGGGTFHANATIQQEAEPLTASVNANWTGIEVPDQWVGQVLHTQGTLAFDGSADAYRADGKMALGPPAHLANIELRIEGSPSSITLTQFDIVQDSGRLAARGVIALAPQLGWNVDAEASGFDPGAFANAWGGDLNFVLASEGAIDDAGPQVSVVLQDLRGRLRGRDLSGHANIALATSKVVSGEADLRSGASHLRFQGDPGDAIDAVVTIDIPTLDDWIPNAEGELRGRFSAQGMWPDLRIDGQARGSSLRMGEMKAESLALNVDVTNPTQPQGTARIEVSGAAAAGMEFASFAASASGDAQSHRLELAANGSPLTTSLALTGSLVDARWTGTLAPLVLDVEDAARLVLQQPVRITHSDAESGISEACFADGEIRLCFEGGMQADGSMQATYTLRGVPLSLANAFVAADASLAFEGVIEGDGQLGRDSAGALSGNMRVFSQGGQIAQQVEHSEASDVLLSFADLSLNAVLEGERAQAQLAARLNETGGLRGDLTASGLSQSAPHVEGNLSASLPSLAVIELFTPQLANVAGRADLQASVRGTLDAPDISGELQLTELAAHVPELGLQLAEGRVLVSPRADGAFDLEGGIRSGDGQLALSGIARLGGMSTIAIEGENFLAADIPGARVIIAPDLSVEHTAERVSIKGEVAIPQAAINLQELPRGGGGGQQASPDVVIVDAKTPQEEQAEAMPIYASVSIQLGEEVDLTGFGLTAEVTGQLTVNERPGEPTTGSGEIRVAGTYKAYGQDLTIQEGQLLFANTPVDNPRLNIVATRQVGDVTAGLRATGYARSPQLTVFSDPEMGQANALSYLVAGKPIDEIGDNEGEGDAVQTAARSLGTAAGGLLAKNLGRRLGVDEFGIKDDEMIGGSAFTIGQYLSPRLYLSYGIGLFEPGEVVTLRYKLTNDIAIQAQSGSEDSRAGIEFRMER